MVSTRNRVNEITSIIGQSFIYLRRNNGYAVFNWAFTKFVSKLVRRLMYRIFRILLNKCCWFPSLFLSLSLSFTSLLCIVRGIHSDVSPGINVNWHAGSPFSLTALPQHAFFRVEMRLAFCQNEKIRFMNERPPLFVGWGYAAELAGEIKLVLSA